MLGIPNNTFGLALNLERDSVGSVILGEYQHISEGDTVKCTGAFSRCRSGRSCSAAVVNALGAPIDGKGPIAAKMTDVIEKVAPGVIARKSVSQPVQTGLRRSTPCADRPRAARAHHRRPPDRQDRGGRRHHHQPEGQDLICVYVAIGQKASTISNVGAQARGARRDGVHDHRGGLGSESAAMQYIAPYFGLHHGRVLPRPRQDALIIYDDLNKQAWA